MYFVVYARDTQTSRRASEHNMDSSLIRHPMRWGGGGVVPQADSKCSVYQHPKCELYHTHKKFDIQKCEGVDVSDCGCTHL